jgi:riboflavin kinase
MWTCKSTATDSSWMGGDAANFPQEIVDELSSDISTGIYMGWASVSGGAVHKMVMSIGWNPFFNNERRSAVRNMCASGRWLRDLG